MTKEEWINSWCGEKWNGNRDVITFIANILYHNGNECESIYNLFAAGYCYYFALMLKDAFQRGEICWHKNFSHIVWVDDDKTAYEIGGIFYDYNEDELVPLSKLGEDLRYFKHVKIEGEGYESNRR